MPLKVKYKAKHSYHHNHNCEDVPFYKLQHSFDELPLDPVKPFILEKIRKSTYVMSLSKYLITKFKISLHEKKNCE